MHHLCADSFPNQEFLSRSQVADLFNVSPSTVTRWADEGKLIYTRTLGGHRRYRKQSVLALAPIFSQEEECVKTATINLPAMFGDHHVNTVHQLLTQLAGVQEVWASAANRLVQISYDPETQTAQEIQARLTAAGYPAQILEAQPDPVLAGTGKDPAWAGLNLRMTQTHPSGD